MDFFEFVLTNWAVITAFFGVVLGYFGGWAITKAAIKQKVSDLAGFFNSLDDAIRDDNVTAEETIVILNKARKVIGQANYDQVLSTLKITRER